MGWPERHVLGAVLRLQPGGWGILESPLRVLSMVSTHKGDVQMQPGLQRTKHHLSGVDTSQTRKGGAGAHGWMSSNAPRSPATFLSFLRLLCRQRVSKDPVRGLEGHPVT